MLRLRADAKRCRTEGILPLLEKNKQELTFYLRRDPGKDRPRQQVQRGIFIKDSRPER